MIVGGGNDDWEAQEWNWRSAVEMYHVLVKMVCIFDGEQTRIDAGKIA